MESGAIRARYLVATVAACGVASWICWRQEAGFGAAEWQELLGPMARGAWKPLWAAVSDLGNGGVVAAFILAVVAWQPDRRQFQNLLLAGCSTAPVTRVIKVLVGRERPDLDGFDAWPSGHSTIAMTLALVFVTARPATRVLAIAVALLVGVSRVFGLRHWPADVFAGFGLAALLALVVARVPLLLRDRLVSRPVILTLCGACALAHAWNVALHPFAQQARFPMVALLLLAAFAGALRLENEAPA